MKTIKSTQIWDNGKIKTASVLNAYAINVSLDQSATFYYSLFSIKDDKIDEKLTEGNLFMDSDIYATWDQDDVAWDFVANSLNLVITGDYIPPQNIDQPVENNPESL